MNKLNIQEKMEINYLLSLFYKESLEENSWKASAQEVLNLLKNVPKTTGITKFKDSKPKNNSINGYAPEYGNIIINEEDNNKKELVFTHDSSLRIGSFKIYIHFCWISFFSFWGSDIHTSGNEEFEFPQQHIIFFDENFKATAYGIEERKKTLSLNLFLWNYEVYQSYSNIVFGDQRYSKIILGKIRVSSKSY